MAKQQTAVVGVALAILAIWLLKRPNCNRGCKTVAEHLLSHGLDDILSGLLA